ncbi:MAG TPA: DNA polymerase Y family protein [Pseudonocardiaceae bacterium]
MPARTIAVWCPDWPVVAAGMVHGVSPERATAVLAANRVLTCSAAARMDGVRRGQRKREAQACSPNLMVFENDRDRDARMFEPVACAVEAMAPGVEVIRPGLLVLAARGPVGYYGGEHQAAERIMDAVAAEAGVECQVGIADGLFAATLAAHRGVVVEAGHSADFLAPLGVAELLRLEADSRAAKGTEELVDLLRRLGLRSLGAFAALPVRDVASRFGAAAVLAHRLAGGHDVRPLTGRPPPVDLAVSRRFDPPVERVDTAAFAAREPAARLHELLADRGLACTRLEVYAETENGEPLSRLWRCAEPLGPAGITDRVRWQLDAWITGAAARSRARGGPTAGITLLRLAPDEVVRVGVLQRGLWGEGEGESSERAGRALVRVQGLLGPDSVFTAVLGGGRDPAQRVRMVAWGDERVPERPVEPPWPGQLPAPSPATVYPPGAAPAAELLDADGVSVGVTARAVLTAPPHRVRVQDGPAGEVLGWAGPWPVEERWWDGGGRRRARLQVTLRDGPPLLLACEHSRWHVEGVYD